MHAPLTRVKPLPADGRFKGGATASEAAGAVLLGARVMRVVEAATNPEGKVQDQIAVRKHASGLLLYLYSCFLMRSPGASCSMAINAGLCIGPR